MVMGCPGVGKSSLIAQLVTGDPDTNCSAQTQTTFTLGTKQISLKLLDIAGVHSARACCSAVMWWARGCYCRSTSSSPMAHRYPGSSNLLPMVPHPATNVVTP